jgi:hypothetical protein
MVVLPCCLWVINRGNIGCYGVWLLLDLLIFLDWYCDIASTVVKFRYISAFLNWILPFLYIEVSILRFTIRILRFDTIQMDKDTNLYFVSLEIRILRIVSVSFCISMRYVSQRYNYFKIRIFFLTLPLLFDFTHLIKRLENPSVRKKGKKRQKMTKKRKNILAIERGAKNSKHETVQVGNSYLFHLFSSLMQGQI